ncbi:MAG: cytochrome-c peroxidase [Bdellovibrionota bacterium]
MGEPILPLPIQVGLKETDKVDLGQRLFHEPRLSKNNTISCASCHDLSRGGVDGRVRSIGINGAEGGINAPTVYNSGFNFRQFWNGRAKTLEDQVDGPLQHAKEMGSDWNDVLARLSADPQYSSAFKKAYPDGVTKANVKNAIATFERSLVTPNAPFDRFLRGDPTAITDREKTGYLRFKSYGCVACHQGVNVGGNMFQTMGVMGRYFEDRKTPISEDDMGRFSVTNDERDMHVFRVPSLRNVALTSPYFHDGSARSLEDAVNVMAKYQLGRKLPKADVDAIVAFLKALTGEMPAVGKAAPK